MEVPGGFIAATLQTSMVPTQSSSGVFPYGVDIFSRKLRLA